MAIPKTLTVTRYTDDVDGLHRSKLIAAHEGAFVRQLDRNSHWIGTRYMLYVPVDGELDSDGDQQYDRIEMEGVEVAVYDGSIELSGFVHVKADGTPVRFIADDTTGLYRREWWSQRATKVTKT
jgi:hypothetical protein